MAHFAELDKDNIVIRTVVVHNNELLDSSNKEQEELGIQFCKKIFGEDTNWVQTSYNEKFRKNFALPGFVYDRHNDAFYAPVCQPGLESGAGCTCDMEFNHTTFKWQTKTIPVKNI